MRGRKIGFSVKLSVPQRTELERWQRSATLRASLARRARVILLLDEGQTLGDTAHVAGMTVRNARKWALRYLDRGIDGLFDKPGRGHKPVFSPRSRVALGEDRLRATG